MENEEIITEELVDLSEEDVVETEVKLIDSDNPYVLATMEGIFMVIEDDNGNGRWYMKDTIVKGILENDYVKRMLECKSLLGESHHPIDRTSIWSDEACICTRELWIDPTGKYLMGRADILDTPKGRIVYTLAKYGTKLGISARANGKGVKQKAHLVIKPEHYFFKTFDVVLNPGFKQARPNLFEKDGRTPLRVYEETNSGETVENLLYEELQDMISNNSCDKKMLKDYIEYCESDKLKELIPLMEDESTEPSEGDTSTSQDVERLLEENNNLKAQIKEYEGKVRSFDTYRSNVESELSEIKSINESLYEELESQKSLLEEIKGNSDVDTLVEELIDIIQNKNEALLRSNKIIALYEEHSSDLDDLSKSLSSENEELLEEVESLSESIEELDGIIDNLNEEEEPVFQEKPQKLFKKKVDMFGSGCKAMNEEMEEVSKVDKSVSNGRVNMIKSLGGM